MRRFHVECDGCGKELEITQEHIDRKKPLTYHLLQLNFHTYMKDPNTNQEEEVSNMARQTQNVYCTDCFMKLTAHLEKFIEEVAPDESDIVRAEYSAVVRKNQSVASDRNNETLEVVPPEGIDALRELIEDKE